MAIGSNGSAAGTALNLTIAGDTNTVDLTQGQLNSATNATITMAITGDLNTFTGAIETDDVTNTFNIAGDSNVFNTVQSGNAGKNIEMTLTGSTNTVSIEQKSTLNVDSINLNSTSNNSSIIIKQCDSGGC